MHFYKLRIFIFSIFLFSLMACGSSSKTVKKTRRPPSTSTDKPKEEAKPKKPDVIKVTEVDPVKKPPIKIDAKSKKDDKNYKNEYNVVMVLPLNASSYNNQQNTSDEQFLQYYAGMKMALEDIETEDFNINVEVVDCSNSKNINDLLRASISDDTDLVVGPYSKNDLDNVMKFCKRKEITVVSPWRSSSNITSKNPYYIQMRPNIKERYFKIIEDISKNYKPEEVVLVARNDAREKRILSYLQEISKYVYKKDSDTLLTEFFINEDSLALGVYAYEDLFEKEKKVFVFPNYSYDDENYLYSCMRRLAVEKGENQVYVYGMPILKDSDKISYDYYSSLNMNIVVSEYVDNDDIDIINFKRRFFQKYGAIAINDAIEGYDLMGFLCMALERYGKNFQNHIEDRTYNGLQSKVQLQKKFNEDQVDEDYEEFDFYENKYLEIIAFKNGKFAAKK